jgi:hypothetical protein
MSLLQVFGRYHVAEIWHVLGIALEDRKIVGGWKLQRKEEQLSSQCCLSRLTGTQRSLGS